MAKVKVGDRVETRHYGKQGGRIGTVRKVSWFGNVEILADDADASGSRIVRVGRQGVKKVSD